MAPPLAAVHRLLSGYRVEGQESVFECLLTAAELRDVVDQLGDLIDRHEDRVHLVQLDPVCLAKAGALHACTGPGNR